MHSEPILLKVVGLVAASGSGIFFDPPNPQHKNDTINQNSKGVSMIKVK